MLLGVERDLAELLADYLQFELQSGHSEQGVACLQALVEFNCFTPAFPGLCCRALSGRWIDSLCIEACSWSRRSCDMSYISFQHGLEVLIRMTLGVLWLALCFLSRIFQMTAWLCVIPVTQTPPASCAPSRPSGTALQRSSVNRARAAGSRPAAGRSRPKPLATPRTVSSVPVQALLCLPSLLLVLSSTGHAAQPEGLLLPDDNLLHKAGCM